MSDHRRLTPTPRLRRGRAVPAYQVRRARSSGAALERQGATGDAPVSPSREPVTEPTVAPDDDRRGPETEAHPVVVPPLAEPDANAVDSAAAANGVEPGAAAADDIAEYAQSIEAAALRSRATPAGEPVRTAATAPATPAHRPGRPRGRPVVGSRVRNGSGGGGRGRGSRTTAGETPHDPRPLLKRPRTWLAIGGIVVIVAAIIGVLWTLNIIRLTYDAYNEAHVESPDRPVYTINPEGTPVVVPTEEVEASLPNWDNRDPFNVLLMGIDDREGDTEPPRSDTMIVVRVNPVTNTVAMMSIPRDLLVYIPVIDAWDKMNAAYPIGEERREGDGPSVVMQTIEYNFGARIHYFVTVDFDGFRAIIDTIGGVVIDVRAPVKDDQYPTEEFGVTRQYFPTGLQMMDGETALRYSRTRYGDNDLMRGDRQQQTLVALREQAMSLGLITRAEELIGQFGEMVRTDLNFNQMLALGNLGRNVDPNGISRINLWDAGVLTEHLPVNDEDAFYLEADWAAIYEIVDTYFGQASVTTPPPTPTSAVAADSSPSSDERPTANGVDLAIPIIVQNDAGIDGLATQVSAALYDVGFETVLPEAGGSGQRETLIYDYVESPETALYIATYLGLDESAIVPGNGGNGIVISVGADLAWILDQ